MDLRDIKTRDYINSDEMKYRIVKNFMKEKRWKEFTIIEMSSVIFSFVLGKNIEDFKAYIKKAEFNKIKFKISDLEEIIAKIDNHKEMFKAENENLLDISNKQVGHYDYFYDYYINKLKSYREDFKKILSSHTCFEISTEKLSDKNFKKYNLYTMLMQSFGNNLRASGDPFDSTYKGYNQILMKRIEKIINKIIDYNERHNERTRICIDAIRNPFEAHFLRDQYRPFYLIAINTDDENRKQRLNMSNDELDNLDKIEYPSKSKNRNELFYHQNIQSCIEIADIHIYNQNIDNEKYFSLSEQLLKYIALIIHPGLITPTHIERCMQQAFNAKYNSGCLSRQVGAVITDEDFSVKAIGWNDVAKGQVPCNLRDIREYCTNKDVKSFSNFEITNPRFSDCLHIINNKLNSNSTGMPIPFCFKDIYNGMLNEKNQVHTRALHAEENAFLQISKYGGTGIQNGKLFSTASPCELCSKKAYQLGIKEIYYIDPYPGISKKHILTFGNDNNPRMILFSGAIGNAYISLYSQRLPLKDEIELITNQSFKEIANSQKYNNIVIHNYDDFIIDSFEKHIIFTSRTLIQMSEKVTIEVNNSSFSKLYRTFKWTGNSKHFYSNDQNKLEEYDDYLIITFDKQKEKKKSYTIQGELHDEEKTMLPYISHRILQKTLKLNLSVTCKEGVLKDVKMVKYADTEMKVKYDTLLPKISKDNDGNITYSFEEEKPYLLYNYCFEWIFG